MPSDLPFWLMFALVIAETMLCRATMGELNSTRRALVEARITAWNYARETGRYAREAAKLNKYAHLLGRTVWVRKYEASRWERAIVVAVSRYGSVAVRRTSDPKESAHWIDKRHVNERVRLDVPEETA